MKIKKICKKEEEFEAQTLKFKAAGVCDYFPAAGYGNRSINLILTMAIFPRPS
jgi:hypothetical protein